MLSCWEGQGQRPRSVKKQEMQILINQKASHEIFQNFERLLKFDHKQGIEFII